MGKREDLEKARITKLFNENYDDIQAASRSHQVTEKGFNERVDIWWANHSQYKTKYQAAKAMLRTSTYANSPEAKAAAAASYFHDAFKDYDILDEFRRLNRTEKGRMLGYSNIHWDRTHQMDVFEGYDATDHRRHLFGISRQNSPDELNIVDLGVI